jgi:phosphonatase-like hydrolase
VVNGIELVVFDMVGTTIEDQNSVVEVFQRVLQENHIATTPEQIRGWRGASKRDAIRFFVEQQFGPQSAKNGERIEKVYHDFQVLLEQRYIDEGVRPIPGSEGTFTWLKEKGIKIATTTGLYHKVAKMIIHSLGWNDSIIDASICSDGVPQGRPAPYMIFRAMEAVSVTDVRAVMKVGDTPLDIRAGRNAGVQSVVGVLSGSHDEESLCRANPSHIIPSVAELPELF